MQSSRVSSKRKYESNRKMFVGGLPPNCTEDALIKATEPIFGRVIRARVQRCVLTHIPKRFGFVIFANPESLTKACQKRWIYICGHVCECKLALPVGSAELKVREHHKYLQDFRDRLATIYYMDQSDAELSISSSDKSDFNNQNKSTLSKTTNRVERYLSFTSRIRYLSLQGIDDGTKKPELTQSYQLFPTTNPNPWNLPWWQAKHTHYH